MNPTTAYLLHDMPPTCHKTKQPTATRTEEQQQHHWHHQLNFPPRQSSTTIDGIAAAIALQPQIKKIARKHTGKDERKSAKFEHGGTGEGNVPKDHLLKIAIAKQPNEELPCHMDDGAFL